MPMPVDFNNPVIARLAAWGKQRDDVRAIVLSSSRTNPTVQDLVDRLSDYDVDIIIGRTAREWYDDRSWITDFGDVLVGVCDEMAEEYGIDENWDALFRTIDLFRDVAVEVGRRLGYPYPHDLDRRVTAYLQEIKELECDH